MARWRMIFGLLLSHAALGPALAETRDITVAQQYGISFLPLMVMEKERLVEKRAHAAGIPLSINWVKLGGPSAMNEGLISGSVHFAAQGVPSLLVMWDRTRDNVGAKAVAAMSTYKLYLVSRNPKVKTVADFGPGDKIAVPSVRVSTQAIMLQMAAEKAFGPKEYTKLDPLTISLSHPDAVLAMASGNAGVNAHFTASPYYEMEMKMPNARLVTTNNEIFGGPGTGVVLTATSRFRDGNPVVFKAFYDGLAEAVDIINRDKQAAARLYLEMSGDKSSTEDSVFKTISDPDYGFRLKPEKTLTLARFMARIGMIKREPASLEDIFFSEAASMGGD